MRDLRRNIATIRIKNGTQIQRISQRLTKHKGRVLNSPQYEGQVAKLHKGKVMNLPLQPPTFNLSLHQHHFLRGDKIPRFYAIEIHPA